MTAPEDGLIQRLEKAANDLGCDGACLVRSDVPEITWGELHEYGALVEEAAAALTAARTQIAQLTAALEKEKTR